MTHTRSIAIVNAHVVPVTAEPFDGGILIEDGAITALGPDLEPPAGIETIDAEGAWALPGLVEAHGHVGIHEESHGWAGQDTNEGSDPNGAALRAIDGIHPTDEGFRDALSGGITTIVVKPGSASPIGGQTVALKTWGRMVDEMALRSPCSMKSALGENPKRFFGQDLHKAPRTRMGVALAIREALVAAENYRVERDHAAAEDKPFARDLTKEALVAVLDRDIPWCQHVHRVDDIATAMRIADEFGYRLVINHGTEAHLLATVLAERGIGVIIGPLITGRSKQELDLRSIRNPGLLAAAGVQIAITTDAPVVPINFLVHQATFAVKEGLDRDVALRSITINPAQLLGLDDRVGSLELGKDGDVVLWSGDPLDVASRARRVVVEGRLVYEFDDEAGVGDTLDPYEELASEDGEFA